MRSPYRDFLEDRCAAEYSLGEMKVASFEAIVRALNDAGVPFIVVGGIAVNTHGYGRVTFDVDLVINFEPEQIRRAFSALAAIGYVPSVPIAAEQFADPDLPAGLDHQQTNDGSPVLERRPSRNPARCLRYGTL